MDTQMPESFVINGVLYVKATQSESRPFERSYTVAEIESLTGVNRQSLYRAVRAGKLTAAFPNGSARGMRIRESDFVSWMEASSAGASS